MRLACMWCLGMAVALLVAGCNTPRATERLKDKATQSVVAGDFERAVGALNDAYGSNQAGEPTSPGGSRSGSADLNEKHAFVWAAERGVVAQLQGDLQASESFLQMAGDQARVFRSRRLGEAAVSWFANETVRSYDGAPHEHAYVEYTRLISALLQAQRLAGVHLPADAGAGTDTHAQQAHSDPVAAEQAYQRAIIYGRGLNNDVLKWVKDIAGSKRYRDDGYARFMAGVSALVQPDPLVDDLQFAALCLNAAVKAYQEHARLLKGDRAFRYEVKGVPAIAQALRLRALSRYDQYALRRALNEQSLDLEQAKSKGLLPSKDHGSVLFLHEQNFIARRHILDIRIVAAYNDKRPWDNGYKRHWGGFVAWANGPSKTALNHLVALPLPGDLVRILAPGGLSVLGFAVPVNRADRPIPAAGSLAIDTSGHGARAQQPLQVIADMDAMARVSLEDHQAGIITKTLTRTIAKQLPVALAARERKRQAEANGKTDLLALAINLIGSGVATATEIADTRCVTMFPGHVEAALVDLPAGEHRLRLLRTDGTEVELGTVRLKPGQLVVVTARSLNQPDLSPNATNKKSS